MRTLLLTDYLNIQNVLNENTVTDWKKNLSENHFKVAIIDEFSELLGSIPWKWWKKGEKIDTWNIKIEAIDILHFGLSIIELNINRVFKCDIDGGDGYWAKNGFGTPEGVNKHCSILYDGNIEYTKAVVALRTLLRPCINISYINDLDCFVSSLGMSGEEVSAIYMAKSTLNKIRQDGGYKTGTYKKHTGGVEDNVRLEHIVDAFMTNTTLDLEDVRKMTITEFTEDSEVQLELNLMD